MIEIKKENVLAAYTAATAEQQKLLELLFGKEIFKPKDVTERIKSLDDAYRELGKGHQFVKEYNALQRANEVLFGGLSMDIVAYLQLRIICAALNEGWEPKFTKDECRYYPFFWLYTKQEIQSMDEEKKSIRRFEPTDNYRTECVNFGCSGSVNASMEAIAHFGSSLCLKNKALAVYCGKQFIDIWADLCLIRK